MKASEEIIKDTPVFLKIPMTGMYIGDIDEFDPEKTIIVEGEECCEDDRIYGGPCACWYVSTTVGACKESFCWLMHEISDCGYIPGYSDFRKGIFSEKFILEYKKKHNIEY